MAINPHIFREFSIRGVADQDLTDDTVQRIGQAAGLFFKARDKTVLVVGRDVRLSSPRISQALITGLVSAGITVHDVGQVPTPVHNFATDFYGADGGIMITASHNPAPDNGMKFRTEHPLQGSELQEIYQLTTNLPALTAEPGTVEPIDPLPHYVEAITKLALPGKPLRVIVDGGNGTNGKIVSKLLQSLGHAVAELYCDPDGEFPNRNPDPTKSEAIRDLAGRITAVKADVGIAYDGDGDRLVVVDEQGTPIPGDRLLMLLARDILKDGPAKIVYEILCSQALADDITAHGGDPIMTPSGYAYVHHAMVESGAALGGELSGHMFCHEPGFRFDDAILATIKVLNLLTEGGRRLSAMVSGLPSYHASPELRIPCPDAIKVQVVDAIKTKFEHDYQVDTIDGARIHFPEGWALVRKSNTQPVMSMRFEARTAAALQSIQGTVQPLVEAEIARLSK